MKKLFLLLMLFSFLLLNGCTNTGAFLSANQTIVNLNEGNYTLAATNLRGESEAGYVLGVSYSTGFTANTLAIARIEGTGSLYAEAIQNLWDNFEAANGSITDRKLALTNIRYDTDILNLLFYTRTKIIIRADVVEFD